MPAIDVQALAVNSLHPGPRGTMTLAACLAPRKPQPDSPQSPVLNQTFGRLRCLPYWYLIMPALLYIISGFPYIETVL